MKSFVHDPQVTTNNEETFLQNFLVILNSSHEEMFPWYYIGQIPRPHTGVTHSKRVKLFLIRQKYSPKMLIQNRSWFTIVKHVMSTVQHIQHGKATSSSIQQIIQYKNTI